MTVATAERMVTMVKLTWAEYFRKIAHTVKLKSKDKTTQIGAVIVGSNNEIRSTGYNSFPRGIPGLRESNPLSPKPGAIEFECSWVETRLFCPCSRTTHHHHSR